MLFHHETNTGDITSEMEKTGYGDLKPPISPENLKALCANDPSLLKFY